MSQSSSYPPLYESLERAAKRAIQLQTTLQEDVSAIADKVVASLERTFGGNKAESIQKLYLNYFPESSDNEFWLLGIRLALPTADFTFAIQLKLVKNSLEITLKNGDNKDNGNKEKTFSIPLYYYQTPVRDQYLSMMDNLTYSIWGDLKLTLDDENRFYYLNSSSSKAFTMTKN